MRILNNLFHRNKATDFALSKTDIALLSLFTRHKGASMSTEYICEQAFGKEETDGGNFVKERIKALQKKLKYSGSNVIENPVQYDEYLRLEYIFVETAKENSAHGNVYTQPERGIIKEGFLI